jgi:hypothetical protein
MRGWRCGSISWSPAYQTESPEFKPQDPQKKKLDGAKDVAQWDRVLA